MDKYIPILILGLMLSACDQSVTNTEGDSSPGSENTSETPSSRANKTDLVSHLRAQLEQTFRARNISTINSSASHIFINAQHPDETGKRVWQIELQPDSNKPAEGSEPVAFHGQSASWGGSEPALLATASSGRAIRVITYIPSASNDMEAALADPTRGHRWRDEAAAIASGLLSFLTEMAD